jgi:uncharacterized phage infection (PIP) family protein YhgE
MMRPSRRIGTALTAGSSIAIVLTVAAGALGLVLVDRAHRSLDGSLGVTIQALDAVDGSISSSRQVTDSIATALDGASATISTIRATMTTATGTLDTIHDVLTGSLTNSIDSIQSVLPTIKSGAGAIDTALTDISKLPIGPDYRPAVPFADSIQSLSDALATVPTDIDSLATKVDDLKGSTKALDGDLSALSATMSTMHDDVVAVRDALDDYIPVIADARRVANQTKRNLGSETTLARLLVTALALALILSEIVSLCIGRLLTAQDSQAEPSTTTPSRPPAISP